MIWKDFSLDKIARYDCLEIGQAFVELWRGSLEENKQVLQKRILLQYPDAVFDEMLQLP